jgi:hypothetical protein
MMNIFRLLLSHRISPNGLYLLISIRDGVSAPGINEAQELRSLRNEYFVSDGITLTPKALLLIEEVENMVKLAKKKVTKAILGPEASDNIDKYRDLFPIGKLPSGVPARVNKKELEAKFQKFLQKYDYTWEEILNATRYYIDEFEKNSPSFIYMKNSSYFISKMTQDKSQESTLANYIELIRSGGNLPVNSTFQDKVI